VCADAAEVARRVAERTAEIITSAVRAAGRCSVVLSGGNTPRALYARWASAFAGTIPWADVQLFWGDERLVPLDDPRSNYKMAKDSLLDRVPCRPDNVHPMPVDRQPVDVAAHEYEHELRQYLGGTSRFDLVLLGLGPDGHTASLFPQSRAIDEPSRWVLPATAPVEPRQRLTLTRLALNNVSHVFFFVTGSEKAHALTNVLTDGSDVRTWPAAGITPEGELVWWADQDAAARIHTAR
jgi:6-phosphogluconolactonase